jgi:calcium-dependent protein kinase
MGEENSKQEKINALRNIGKEANKRSPQEFESFTPIKVTNELLVSESNSDPDKDYKKIKFLGEGSFGAVYQVRNKYSGAICAMKIIKKSSACSREEEEEIRNEINILRTMDHPNILKIFEFYSNPKEYSIITELCSMGELFDQIINKGPFDEKYSAYVLYQVFSAVNYCHKMHILHRDLKPENILIIDKNEDGYPTIKVCDFGTAKIFQTGKVERKFVGSSYYMAPEVLKQRYNEKCDIWSCGVIMYILLSQRPPFGGKDDDEIMANIEKGKYDLSSPPFDKISQNARDLIKKMLTMDPQKRISAEEVLNHPWFKENKSKELFNKVKHRNAIKDIITNLKSYRRTSVIQETALAYLVHQFPQIKDVVNACKLFNQIDHSLDGKITKDELYKGISSLYKSSTLKKDIDEIFKNLDMDNSGYIGYEEFVRGAVNKSYFTQPFILKFAFKYFDKDNSGEITFKEIEELFYKSIPDKNKVHETLNAIIKEVDINNDKKISFKEFTQIMKSMIK